MCGITGVIHFDGRPPDPRRLDAMTQALAHRGPDSSGVYTDAAAPPSVGLGHRRLSVIDLSAAADQPASSEDGRVRVSFNGEVYNFRTLRRELEARYRFRSGGDAEVVAQLYRDRGEGAIPLLDGMFAVAIWDSERRELVLARDPLGKKPLYYWHNECSFVFGSEIKALLAGGVPASLDDSRLSAYLAYGYVPTPNTLFRGIKKLPPGSTLRVTPQGVGPAASYWKPTFPDERDVEPVTLAEAGARVRSWLSQAVQKRLEADVPLGVLLSGGVDSSAVAAVTSRLVDRPVKTFAVGFEGPPFFDERPAARSVARHLGTEHHEFLVRPDAAALVEKLLDHYDEPFGDSSALPTYIVAGEARRHVTVVLNGDGGDEVFAGYRQFHAASLAAAIPGPARRLFGGLAHLLPELGSERGSLRTLRRFLVKARASLPERLFAWSNYTQLADVEAIARSHAADRDHLLASYAQALRDCTGASPLSQALYVSMRTFLLDDLLPKMDRMTMAHGLETRSPLLDRSLIERAAMLPDRVKMWRGNGKLVLKEAVAPLLPSEILARPKHGFGVPVGAWFRTELRDLVQSTLLDRPRLDSFLRPGVASRVDEEHRSGHRDRGNLLWMLLTLELWLRRHRFG